MKWLRKKRSPRFIAISGERGRHVEREAEAVYLAQERLEEGEAELGASIAEQRQVDGERAREVAGDQAERALWSQTTTRSRVAATVTAMLARLAST